MENGNEYMNIVIIGHVDHGKSTVIGRLLSDTGSLPEGKLELVRSICAKNAKPFEYAFLLDALKNEQAQGITIDSARCFFKSSKRHYIIIDAPGHIEFIKNMITGASRAEAALIVIDAKEGVQENSRRHGFMVSLLGIDQIVVLINKIDIVGYDEDIFNKIKNDYSNFLDQIEVKPIEFIPISARNGDNITVRTDKLRWFAGPTLLESVDNFRKPEPMEHMPFRFPVQDIYKFTEDDDDRRIVAGTVASGTIKVGDDVIFLPSQKKSNIISIEAFNEPQAQEIHIGKATGFTLSSELYIKPGEMMCKQGDTLPETGNTFKVNLFWIGKKPMISRKKYKLKIGSDRLAVYLKDVLNIIDASSLTTEANKQHINRHDIAECILQTLKPTTFDLAATQEETSRFVIVDDNEIAGGGVIIESITEAISFVKEHVSNRKFSWVNSNIDSINRALKYNQMPKFIVITGSNSASMENLAKSLEEDLFNEGRSVYYIGISNIISGLNFDVENGVWGRDDHIRRLGETSHLFLKAGMIIIATIHDLDSFEIDMLKELSESDDIIVIHMGKTYLENDKSDIHLDEGEPIDEAILRLKSMFYNLQILIDYCI